VSTAPGGEVARGEGMPIKPFRDILETHVNGCLPIGGDAKTPLRPAKIEGPVPPRCFDSARHDCGLCGNRGRGRLTPPAWRESRAASTCSTCCCSACSAEPAERQRCSSVSVGRVRSLRPHPCGALWLDSSPTPLSIEARAPGRALSALRPGVAVEEEVRSLGGFRARSMRSVSIQQICAESYNFGRPAWTLS
jgi:hypothetical protein